MQIYTWNNESLESYLNTTVVQWLDSTANRELSKAHLYVDSQAQFIDTTTYINATTGVATVNYPVYNYCQYTPLNFSMNLKDLITLVNDPETGSTTYYGVTTLPWNADTFHHFTIQVSLDGSNKQSDIQHLYLTTDEQFKLRYFTVDSIPYVYESLNGFEARTFNDADFAGTQTCPSEGFSFRKVLSKAALPTHILHNHGFGLLF